LRRRQIGFYARYPVIFYFIFLHFFKATLAAVQGRLIEALSWRQRWRQAAHMKPNLHTVVKSRVVARRARPRDLRRP
jgi:hypothetical protein